MKYKALDHGMLLDGKKLMDNVIGEVEEFLNDHVAPALNAEISSFMCKLEHMLAECDVAEQYDEKTK